MKLTDYIKTEINSLGKYERIFFPLIILFVILVSVYTKDNKIALISAICGMTYTILAGKGKIYCYYIGFLGTACYCYLSYKNGFYGNLMLYGLYFAPMEILGIINWRKHLKKNSGEIIKTQLNTTDRIKYSVISLFLTGIIFYILKTMNASNPYIDSITTGLSIVGQFLTLKRCIEQWFIWVTVNLLSLIMWLIAFINGSDVIAIVLMWFVYLILAIYFYFSWKKEIKNYG